MNEIVYSVFFDVANSIVSTGQTYFGQHLASSAQKAIKLRGAGVVRHRLDNS
jgi:hypothetical protein